jgi:hypothetical protein
MNTRVHPVSSGAGPVGRGSTSELLLLPDGRVLVHNLTPAFAELLSALNPADGQIGPRVNRGGDSPASRPEPSPDSP